MVLLESEYTVALTDICVFLAVPLSEMEYFREVLEENSFRLSDRLILRRQRCACLFAARAGTGVAI